MSESTELCRAVRGTLMPGFVGFTPPEWLLTALGDGVDGGLRSVCVYGGNIHDARQLHSLGAELRGAGPGSLIAIDEEGGEVTRLHYREGSPYPGAAVLGRIDDPGYTAEIGARVGRDILTHGFNLALAPDADVNSNAENPVIGTRSFGADPALVSRHVAAWVHGLQSSGAVACPKHFPGHGDTALDSHLALPVVDALLPELAERDLPPFAAAFDAGARAAMTSHILLPAVDPERPATFSRTILHDVLRDRLGFTGVVVSDALDMRGASGGIGVAEAAIRALDAGCDLLCLGTGTTAEKLREIEDRVLAAIAEGRLGEDRVRDAAARVRALAEASAPAAALPAALPAAVPAAPPVTVPAALPNPEAARTSLAPDEIARVARSFDGVGVARAWLAEHPRASVIRVEVESNMAVGGAPWGPFAAAATDAARDAARAFAARPMRAVDASTPLPWPVGDAGNADRTGGADPAGAGAADGVIVVGRNLHRHAFARAGIDGLRAAGVPVLTVETGWPEAAPTVPGYADLASYGSSALAGAALLGLFAGEPS